MQHMARSGREVTGGMGGRLIPCPYSLFRLQMASVVIIWPETSNMVRRGESCGWDSEEASLKSDLAMAKRYKAGGQFSFR